LIDGLHGRRFLALAAIYAGATGTEAAKIGGVTPQTVRDWGDEVQRLGARRPDRSFDGDRRWDERRMIARRFPACHVTAFSFGRKRAQAL